MDITERKVAEVGEIRRSEAYLAEAQRLSHTGSFGWKPDDGEIVWSDETYRIFEYDRTAKANSRFSGAACPSSGSGPPIRQVIDGASQAAHRFRA